MKIHKNPLKTGPIVSTSGSLIHAIAVWIDDKLQIVAQMQRSCFKSSVILHTELDGIEIPPNSYLFTADTVGMYTNRAIRLLVARHITLVLPFEETDSEECRQSTIVSE